MLIESPTAYLAAVLALGILAQWLAWRLRLPAIVLLLGIGFAARYGFGPPEHFLSKQFLLPIVALGVGIILFEGGLSLRLRELRDTGGIVFRLVTVGLVTTWLLTAYAAYLTLGFSWELALLIGALLTVSGPTVIVPLLPHVRPVGRMSSLIKWEGIVNDPIGVMLTALVFKAIVQEAWGDAGSHWLWGLGATLSVGVLLGGITAWITIQLLRRYWVPDSLQNPVVLALVLLVFAISNHFQKESGLLTVTIMGVILANQTHGDGQARHRIQREPARAVDFDALHPAGFGRRPVGGAARGGLAHTRVSRGDGADRPSRVGLRGHGGE